MYRDTVNPYLGSTAVKGATSCPCHKQSWSLREIFLYSESAMCSWSVVALPDQQQR